MDIERPPYIKNVPVATRDNSGYGITGHLHVSADLTTFLKEKDGLEEMDRRLGSLGNPA
jgi:hypothetical protein